MQTSERWKHTDTPKHTQIRISIHTYSDDNNKRSQHFPFFLFRFPFTDCALSLICICLNDFLFIYLTISDLFIRFLCSGVKSFVVWDNLMVTRVLGSFKKWGVLWNANSFEAAAAAAAGALFPHLSSQTFFSRTLIWPPRLRPSPSVKLHAANYALSRHSVTHRTQQVGGMGIVVIYGRDCSQKSFVEKLQIPGT